MIDLHWNQVVQTPLFKVDGYEPSLGPGIDSNNLDVISIYRSRIGVHDNSLQGTIGVQRMRDFEKLVHFIVKCKSFQFFTKIQMF